MHNNNLELKTKEKELSLHRLKSLESNELRLMHKISFMEKQADSVKGKMKNLFLNIKKIANDSIHRNSKVKKLSFL